MQSRLIILLFILCSPLGLFAQEEGGETTTTVESATTEAAEQSNQTGEPLQAPASPNDKGVEKIEVTGSHIKRIDVEGPSPVLTLDREYIQRSGYNSVSDVLRDSTVTATGVGRESAGSNVSGAATTGLRGFGADKVLILLNGQRLPKIGGGNSVDLNLIPFQAVEKIEILKDGASAIYGSDALAGVINFITKKDFDGSTVMYRFSAPEDGGGQRQDISAVYGSNFDKGNILAIYQYRSNKELKSSEREWTRGNGEPISPFGSPGSFRPSDDTGDVDSWQADPTCPANSVRADGFCGFDWTPFAWELPAIEQHSATITGEYEINESLKFFSNILYTQRVSTWQFAPAPDTFADDSQVGGNDNTIPASVANTWGIANGGEPIEVRYRLVDELGPRASRDTTDSYGGTMGMRGYMGDSWEWDYTVTYGASNIYNDGHNGYASKSTLVSLMQSNQFNPFDRTTTANLNSARVRSEQWIDSSLTMTQLRANGEIANFGESILSAAVGLMGAWEDYEERVDPTTAAGDLFGGIGANGQGSRSFQAFFTELGYAISNWEFQLAGRFDRYSDFGETVNPKFGIRYLPWKELMFRGSIGTGFRAPTLDELYSQQSYGFPFVVDRVGCAADGGTGPRCGFQQYRTLQGGNTNLKEETSFTYNVGTVLQPTRDFSFAVDYWYTEINDAIGYSLNDLMLAEQNLGNSGLPSGLSVQRDGDPTTGDINTIVAPTINIARQEAQGLDFAIDYKFRIWGIDINPHMDHSHYLDYRETPFEGLPEFSKIDWAGRPRWRNFTYITFGFLDAHSVRVTGRTTPGQFKARHTIDQSDKRRTRDHTEYDLDYRFNAFWNGQINIGVKNMFGTDRPLDDTAGFSNQLNVGLYDQLGRLYYMGYTQSF